MACFYSRLLLFMLIRFVYTDTFSKKIPVRLGLNDSGPAIVSSAQLPSNIVCAKHCLNLEGCLAAVYHSGSQVCSFLNSNETLIDTSDLGHSYLFIGEHCREGWVEFEGSCYFFGNQTYTWQGAMDYCISEGATLVEIETAKENVFLQNKLGTITHPKNWIGMTDIDTEGLRMWASGVSASYIDWLDGEPNQGLTANCGAVWETHGYKWSDEPCYMDYNPICEQRSYSFH